MNIAKLRNYFYKLGESIDPLKYVIYGSFDKIRLADSRDQSATLDRIASTSAGKALKSNKRFSGFCKISEARFYRNLSNRTTPFYIEQRKKLKAEAAKLQLTNFSETISRSTLEKASSLMVKHLGLTNKRFRPASIEEAASTLKLQTSSGFPWLRKKGQVLDEIIDWASHFLDPKNWNPALLLKFPTYVSYRVQQRPSDVKLRLIYVYSAIIVVMEQLFLVPLLNYFIAKRSTPYVVGNVGSDLVLRWNNWQRRENIVSLDWQAFDQSASRLLIMQSFSIIKNCFDMTKFDSLVFDFVAYYFVNTPVITNVDTYSSASVIIKKRGVPSGSSFTNMVDSFVNMLIIYCYLVEMGYEVDPDFIAILGDDVILATNARFSLIHFSDWSLSKFGMTLSLEKSKIYKRGEPVYFLGALIDANGRYCNPELLLYQMCSTTSDLFKKCSTSRDHIERLWDKFCSICFKYSDGYIVLDAVWPYVEEYLGISHYSSEYTEIFSRATVPGSSDEEIGTTKNYWTMRTLGWFIQ